ncbi:adenine-specific methyltransferase EcoRI family protein [Arundinibacter roseus]|uniref:DNA methyltransferase n=1 Tax=Arundinibacter roseus TaxID=2070510 RepID=A0A4R4K9K9_9BACT|nr:adenine-specific methyltransferase EcoRI family protein [Arundinibacter roseus]TDB64418.1 DNA methyltransferase [Arundinibacter roseus]
MANINLSKAKNAKNDEFYTQYHDIEKEINAYLDFDPDVFRGKTILLPCDDPEWSNFTKFFAQNFESIGLKKLISTSYAVESKHYKTGYQVTMFEESAPQFDKSKTTKNGKIFSLTHDLLGDGKIDVNDLEWQYLKGDGDFNSKEVKKLRDEADFIITNPPFSLFRDFLSWIVEGDKQFVIIGNMNAIKYKEVFPLIMENKMWLGNGFQAGNAFFSTPFAEEYGEGVYNQETGLVKFRNVCWFTNLDHGRRHQPMQLMTLADNLRFNKKVKNSSDVYERYENYDAIEVPFTDAIPSDYTGLMGVPISFLDKYSPEQFEIVWQASGNTRASAPKKVLQQLGYIVHPDDRGGCSIVNGRRTYDRIFIRHKIANK